jgi:sulfur-carrier protein
MTASQNRNVELLYFAWVREKVGRASETRALPADVATVADLVTWLKTQGPEYQTAFTSADIVRAAIDQRHVKPETALGDAREIAFFPPVTGG